MFAFYFRKKGYDKWFLTVSATAAVVIAEDYAPIRSYLFSTDCSKGSSIARSTAILFMAD